MTQIPINLKRWRNIRGFTQAELAEKAGVSRQGYMKLERGDSAPRTETLLSIANALGIQVPELIKEEPRWRSLRFRTGKVATQKIQAERRQTLIEVHNWLEFYNDIERELKEKTPFRFEHITAPTPEILANRIREELRFGNRLPIPDLFESIEEAGIKLYLMKSQIPDLFGMSVGIDDGGPCIAVNTNEDISIERQIFTAAHELGHLLMHKGSYLPSDAPMQNEDIREETEANEFASHLLMPQEALVEEWNDNLGLHWIDRILKIKKYFKVSYRTVLMRIAQEYGDNNAKTQLFIRFNRDYQTKYQHDLKNHYEPDSLAAENEPQKTGIKDFEVQEERFERLVRRALERNIITISKAAEVLKIDMNKMRSLADAWSEEPQIFE
jgi:Zn-dependent peptidase ImmA (M78 family)/DNA-binding XRE family transcriptional regulator